MYVDPDFPTKKALKEALRRLGMAYKLGDAQLVTETSFEEDNFLEAGTVRNGVQGDDWWMPSDARGGTVEGFPYVKLPHSCDSWIVGGPQQVALMIAELTRLLAQMEER